jgi:BMFP domain-containing protein YqiC
LDHLYLDLAFEGLMLGRPFAKWMIGLDLVNDDQFYVEPINTDGEWDFFFDSPWQLSSITLPAKDFAIQVKGDFRCDAILPLLQKKLHDAVTKEMEIEQKIRDLHNDIFSCMKLVDATEILGQKDLGAPHRYRLDSLKTEMSMLQTEKNNLRKTFSEDSKKLDELIDVLVIGILAPLRAQPEPWGSTTVKVRISGADWREVPSKREIDWQEVYGKGDAS